MTESMLATPQPERLFSPSESRFPFHFQFAQRLYTTLGAVVVVAVGTNPIPQITSYDIL